MLFRAGGNGGRGELLSSILNVTPLLITNIVVGKGGTAGKTATYGTAAIAGGSGGSSSILSITARGGGGGGRGYAYEGNYQTGRDGTSYEGGASGGNGAKSRGSNPTAGANGWVKIAYGEGIE